MDIGTLQHLHKESSSAGGDALGASELLPIVAILPFMLYQLAGFGTLYFVVSKAVNWIVNIGTLRLIIAVTSPIARASTGWKGSSAES